MKIDLRNLKQFLPFFNAFQVFYTIRRHPLTTYTPKEGRGSKAIEGAYAIIEGTCKKGM
jgi:hypothetical protein